MKCSKCGGKVKVADSVKNENTNEIYRERRCEECYHVFYTIEFEVERTSEFEEDWYEHHRSYSYKNK